LINTIRREAPAKAKSRLHPGLRLYPAITLLSLNIFIVPAVEAQEKPRSEIVVTAKRVPENTSPPLPAERIVASEEAAAYGADTIGQLVDMIASENGDSDRPVLMINGTPVADEGDIVDYPVGAVDRIEILPRGSAIRFGGRGNQRAYNIVLKRLFKTNVADGRMRVATEGGWSETRGELNLTRIAGEKRLSITAQVRREAQLLESERGVRQPAGSLPFDLLGNIFADPRRGSDEVDPLLSEAVGRRTVVAGVPGGISTPSILDFAERAGRTNESDAGRFRSLRPSLQSYNFALNASHPLAEWARTTLTANLQHYEYVSLQGAPTGLVALSPDNNFSPFSVPVVVSRAFGTAPLTSQSSASRGNISFAANANLRKWFISASGEFAFTKNSIATARQAQDSGALIFIPNDVNPFATRFGDVVRSETDIAKADTERFTVRFSVTGPLLALPSGPLQISLNSELQQLRQGSQFETSLNVPRGVSDRAERLIQGSLEVPIFSREGGGVRFLGDISVSLDQAITDVRGAGSLRRTGYAGSWEPVRDFVLRASFNRQSILADIELQRGPLILTEGVRYFNPLLGETVDVTEISGGNPDLTSEQITTKRLSATVSMMQKSGIVLDAEYIAVRRNAPITLQLPASADLLAAFSDRLIRGVDGGLIAVDVRPLNLDRSDSKQFRWGVNFTKRLSPTPMSQTSPTTSGSRLQLHATLSHRIQLSEQVVTRTGFPATNLLKGGALGFSGGTSRHRVDFGLNLNDRGTGLRVSGSWLSASFLDTADGEAGRLRFSPIANFNTSAFTDLDRLLPGASMWKGTRVSLSVMNLFHKRQGVIGTNGETPLAYQSAYRDPIGRTVEVGLRKTF